MRDLRIAGIVFVLLGLSLATFTFALPTGPNAPITPISVSRYDASTAGQDVDAYAGNVTEMDLAATIITQTWQGYFGNVTGNIVLGDANNNTMYNWDLTSPSGQIYATRTGSVPTWTSIRCANITNVGSEETALGVTQATAADSVNNTFFNTTSFTGFYVGTVNINTTQDCYAVRLHNSTGVPSTTNFAEVLLHDNTNLVYTTILDKNAVGFDNAPHDFQMIVGENGHNGDTTSTAYYFYLELQ
jgi:hypothetical protein